MGVTFTKFGKYNSEKMENKDAKKHSNMLCFNARSDSLSIPYENNNDLIQKKRFSLNRLKRRCKKSGGGDDLEGLREEFDRVNRIRYDLESNKPIRTDDSLGNCDGLVCLHNGSTVIRKSSRSNSLGEEGKSKSVDYLHEKEKDDDSLSFLSVKSEIITTSRRSSVDGVFVDAEVIMEEPPSCQISDTKEESSTIGESGLGSTTLGPSDTGNEMDPTPPNSPQETIVDITYGTVLGEQNIEELKSKIQKVIYRQTESIAEEEEDDENS